MQWRYNEDVEESANAREQNRMRVRALSTARGVYFDGE